MVDDRALTSCPMWQAVLAEVLHWDRQPCPMERLVARTGLYPTDLHWVLHQMRQAMHWAALDKSLQWLPSDAHAVRLVPDGVPVTIHRVRGYPEGEPTA